MRIVLVGIAVISPTLHAQVPSFDAVSIRANTSGSFDEPFQQIGLIATGIHDVPVDRFKAKLVPNLEEP